MASPTPTPHDPATAVDGATDAPSDPRGRGLSAAVDRIDDAVDRAWAPLRRSKVANRAMYTITELGDNGVGWLILAAAHGLRGGDHERNAFRIFAALTAESILVNGPVKLAFRRKRPVHQGERPHHLRIPITSSFPSGHAASAAMSAVLLADAQPALGPLYGALAVAVAASRVHVRIHHASDVAAGLLLGWGLGQVGVRLWPLDAPPGGLDGLLPG